MREKNKANYDQKQILEGLRDSWWDWFFLYIYTTKIRRRPTKYDYFITKGKLDFYYVKLKLPNRYLILIPSSHFFYAEYLVKVISHIRFNIFSYQKDAIFYKLNRWFFFFSIFWGRTSYHLSDVYYDYFLSWENWIFIMSTWIYQIGTQYSFLFCSSRHIKKNSHPLSYPL